jgi:hypothetical protein
LIDSGATFAFTPLHVLELRNAFKLGIFRKLLTTVEAAAAWRNVERLAERKIGSTASQMAFRSASGRAFE